LLLQLILQPAVWGQPLKSGQQVLVTTYNDHWNIPIAAFQTKTVRVWKDTRDKFVLQPYLRPDWNKASKDFESVCAGKNDNDLVEISVEAELDSSSVIAEVVRYLNSRGIANDLDFAALGAYPWSVMKFVTGGAAASDNVPVTVRQRLPVGLESTAPNELIGVNYSFYGVQQIPLIDTCSQLRAIVKRKDLQAQMFALFNEVKVNVMSVALREFKNQQAVRDLFVDQSLSGSKRLMWTSKASSTGINLGFASWGRSKVSGSVSPIDDRRRAVSSSLLSDVVAEASRSLSAKYVTELKSASIDASTLFKTLMDIVTSRSKEEIGQFNKVSDNQWEFSTSEITWLLDQSAVAELIQAKIEMDSATKEDTKAAYQGAEASEKKEATFKVNQDVQWKTDGPTPIPVSAKIRIVDENSLSYDDVASWEEAQVSAREGILVISVDHIDAPDATYTGAFRDGFRQASLHYLGPPKETLPMPRRLWPDYSQPRPYVPLIQCEDNTSAIARANVEVEKETPPTGFKNANAFVAAIGEFVKQVGCKPFETTASSVTLANFDATTVLVWADQCFITVAWDAWFRVHLTEIGARYLPGAGCADRPIFPLAEPLLHQIGPSADVTTVTKEATPPSQ
jgi:hypothetical protein